MLKNSLLPNMCCHSPITLRCRLATAVPHSLFRRSIIAPLSSLTHLTNRQSERKHLEVSICILIYVTFKKRSEHLSGVTHLLSTSEVLSPVRSTLVLSSSMTSTPSLYQVTLGGGLPWKGILMVAVWPAFTVRGWAPNKSSTEESISGGSGE